MLRRKLLAVFPVVLALAPLGIEAAEPRAPLHRASVKDVSIRPVRAYVGVLGAVGRPGVYEVSEKSSSLAELMSRSGGLSGDATGNMRIIRNGKPGQQVFFTALNKFPLQSGDVIFVDGKLTRAQAIRTASHVADPRQPAHRAANALPEDRPPVQLAFVNVVDRPVVLKVRAEHATVESLVQLLNQSSQAADRARIVPPAGLIGNAAPLTKTTPLVSGTVIVFDPETIDFARIPALPPAYGFDGQTVQSADGVAPVVGVDETSAGGQAAAAVIPSQGTENPASMPALGAGPSSFSPPALSTPNSISDEQSPRLERTVGPGRDPRDLSSAEHQQIAQGQGVEYLPPSPAGAEPSFQSLPPSVETGAGLRPRSPGELGAGPDRIIAGESEPIDGGSRIRPGIVEPRFPLTLPKPAGSIASNTPEERANAATRAASALATMTSKPKATGPAVKLTSSTEPVVEAGASNIEIASIWGIFGVVAVIAAWMASRRSSAQPAPARTEMAAAAAIAPARVAVSNPNRSRLDDLISNAMPMDVERVRIPGRVEFFGKANAKPYLRVDASHEGEMRGPHFAEAEARAARRTGAMASSASEVAPEMNSAADAMRVDGAHDEPRPHAAGAPSRQTSDRKADLLERVLTTVQDSGSRHVGGPHISAVPRTSEVVSMEGASQT